MSNISRSDYLDLAVKSHSTKTVSEGFDWKKMTPVEKKGYLQFVHSILSKPETPEELKTFYTQLVKSEEAAIDEKSGHLWKCIDYANGIYAYHLRDEYDPGKTKGAVEASLKKQGEISPAVEVSSDEVRYFLDTSKADNILRRPHQAIHLMTLRSAYELLGLKLFALLDNNDDKRILLALIFEELGYGMKKGSDGKILYLPDAETLKTRWAKLQEKNPGLADLDVLMVDGIADDEPFVEGYIFHILVSAKGEFVHDHVAHVVKQIAFLVSLAGKRIDFKKEKHASVLALFALYKKILCVKHHHSRLDPNYSFTATEISMLMKSLGALVDAISAFPDQDKPSDYADKIRKIFYDPLFSRLAIEEFGKENMERLSFLWTKLDLATAPIFEYPKTLLPPAEVKQLFQENPHLPAVVDSRFLYIRTPKLKLPCKVVQEANGNYMLKVDHGCDYYDASLGKNRTLSAEDLRKIIEIFSFLA